MSEEIIPIFRANDARKLAEWYERLGFEIEGEHRFSPKFPLYVYLKRGSIRLHLSEHKGDARKKSLVYMWVENLDEIAKDFSEKISEQPWGREVCLEDPDGNRLRIGQKKAKAD